MPSYESLVPSFDRRKPFDLHVPEGKAVTIYESTTAPLVAIKRIPGVTWKK